MSAAEKGTILPKNTGGAIAECIKPDEQPSGMSEDTQIQARTSYRLRFTQYRSVQEFPEYRRDDLYLAPGSSDSFARRIIPRTIGKLVIPSPHPERIIELSEEAVRAIKQRTSQQNIADGKDNEAKTSLRRSQFIQMICTSDGKALQSVTEGMKHKLGRLTKSYKVKLAEGR